MTHIASPEEELAVLREALEELRAENSRLVGVLDRYKIAVQVVATAAAFAVNEAPDWIGELF